MRWFLLDRLFEKLFTLKPTLISIGEVKYDSEDASISESFLFYWKMFV